MVPNPTPTEPTSSGFSIPARSIHRPAVTESSAGNSAYMAMRMPTVSAEAPRWMAYSVTVTRLPLKAT